MPEVKLRFVRGPDWSSRAIARYGLPSAGFSHVDIVLPTGELAGARSDSVGGQPQGFQIRPADYGKWDAVATVALQATWAQVNTGIEWIHSKLGEKYDKPAIWGFIFGMDLHEAGATICSAAGADYLYQTGHVLKWPVPFHEISPDVLYVAMGALGGQIT